MSDTLIGLWDETERRHGDRVALIHGARSWTYRELGKRIRALTHTLSTRIPLIPGEPIALLAPNGAEFVIAYFAILRLGGAVQPIDTRTPSQRWLTQLADTRTRVLVVPEVSAAAANRTAAGSNYPDQVISVDSSASSDGDPGGAGEITGDSIAELMHTSGTTGIAKAAMRTHRNVLAAAGQATRGFRYGPEDVIAIAMPLSHSSALNSQLIPFIRFGAAIVLIDRFEPDEVIETLGRHSVTCMRLVPSMVQLLLARAGFSGERLPSIRMLINSSAPIAPERLSLLEQRFPKVAVMDSYGLTEASTCTVIEVGAAQGRRGSVGRAIDGVTLEVADERGRPVAAGEEGEVRVRGDHVFAGYRDNPGETARALRNGWLWTGDLGHLDGDGYLYLHGRSSEVIHCSGYTVHPATVENCIREMPDVEGVAAIGVPHRVLGQVVKAFVVPRAGGLSTRAVVRHCVRRLPSHAVPFQVEFVETLPLSATGKLMRTQLKEASR